MPTTVRPFSARHPATSSPPTPIPSTTASTRSAIGFWSGGQRLSGDGDRFRQGLLERQRLSFRPRPVGNLLAQALSSCATLLLAEQRAEAGAGRGLMRLSGAGQPRGLIRIAIDPDDLGEVVELQHHARDVIRLLEQT